MKKIIVIETCHECPQFGKCKAWKKLTTTQRVRLKIGTGIGKFILKDCPLPDIDPFPVISFHELQNTDIYEPDMQKYIRKVLKIKGGEKAIKKLDDLDNQMADLKPEDDNGWKTLNAKYMQYLSLFFSLPSKDEI